MVHLSKGSDSQLKKLASETLAGPSGADAQFQLANGWWSQANKLEGVPSDNVKAYAGELYQSALPGLTGLSKVTAEKRLAEVPKSVAAAR